MRSYLIHLGTSRKSSASEPSFSKCFSAKLLITACCVLMVLMAMLNRVRAWDGLAVVVTESAYASMFANVPSRSDSKARTAGSAAAGAAAAGAGAAGMPLAATGDGSGAVNEDVTSSSASTVALSNRPVRRFTSASMLAACALGLRVRVAHKELRGAEGFGQTAACTCTE